MFIYVPHKIGNFYGNHFFKTELWKGKTDQQFYLAQLVFLHNYRSLHFYNVSLIRNFQEKLMRLDVAFLSTLLRYRNMVFFSFYIIGFLLFVIALKKGFRKYQIRMFFWTHCVLIFTGGLSFGMLSIYEGMIWAVLSACCGKHFYKATGLFI